MARYCVLGSINIDLVTRVRLFPNPGETIEGISFATFPGGKGANQSIALSRLGVNVGIVGKIGNDAFGDQYRLEFESEGVDITALETADNIATGTASIEVNDTGENHIVVVPGANGLVDIDFVESARNVIESSDFLLLQLEIPLESVLIAASIAQAARRMVILDPAPARRLPDELLALTTVLTPNETEAKTLTGEDSSTEIGIHKAGKYLLRSGVEIAIIKAGSRGAYIIAEGYFEHVPGFRVDVVDTTAAGDSFNAGLAVALGEGRKIAEAVRFANAVAAISTTREGAQKAMPTRKEVDLFLAKYC